MLKSTPVSGDRLLVLPENPGAALSIRAKAMLFHDPQSIDLIEQVDRVADTDATVLIVGETGTGKELIARHVHRRSGRKGPFLAVNCGAFSESLIDAELFGHESGAFTGAAQARAGWFESANGGTLFLDEIGDLPLPLRVTLLRVLHLGVKRTGKPGCQALVVGTDGTARPELGQRVHQQQAAGGVHVQAAVLCVGRMPCAAVTAEDGVAAPVVARLQEQGTGLQVQHVAEARVQPELLSSSRKALK